MIIETCLLSEEEKNRGETGPGYAETSSIERERSGMSFEEFLGDTKTQDAVIRNIEIIGEATKTLNRYTTSFNFYMWEEL